MFSNHTLIQNYVPFDTLRKGNFFRPVFDDAEILNLHGEIGGKITPAISFISQANYYRYTLTENAFAWNKPSWDATLGLKYNLMNKVIAGVDIQAGGERKLLHTTEYLAIAGTIPPVNKQIDMPAYLNFNLSAEYRYTKILSFWIKLNNIGFSKYYEWAFYPSQRFIGMVGFTYSL